MKPTMSCNGPKRAPTHHHKGCKAIWQHELETIKDIALLGGWQMAEKVIGKVAGQHQCLTGGWDTAT